MQIHELTKRNKRTDEGILDGLKAAVNVAKTGADSFASHMVPGYDTAKAGIQAAKTGYKQGGMKGLGKALVSNPALAQAQGQQLQKQSEKGLQDLKAQGINAKKPLSFYVNQLKNPTDPEFKDASAQSKQEIQKLVPAAEKQFVVGPVLPDPGYVLIVTSGGGKYYKDVNNKWYTEEGRVVPSTNAAPLEALIDNDQYSQTSPPSFLASQQAATPAKTKQPSAPLKEAAPRVQPGQMSQRAQQRNTPAATTQPAAQPAAPTNNQSALKAQLQAKHGPVATQQQTGMQKLAGKEQGIAQQKAAASKPSKVRGKKALKAGFEKWIAQSLKGFDTIGATDRQILNQKFKQLLATKNDAALVDYIITAQAAILKSKTEQNMGTDDGSTPAGGEEAGTVIQRMKQTGIKSTGNPEYDTELKSLGVPILKESQVYITKDIIVKTSKGDYVKRHSDQEWYDPNGVRIDPDKYAEYIAKLDATPQAQTRYQADAEKGLGSDEGVKKAQQAKANTPAPKIELPKATAADWEEYKAQQNRLNNQAIDKTVNDLRNAEYFNTDQQQYLQQQLAQLMAKKF